jgi:hypothetical protein
MMRERPAGEPAEYVIWAASGLLALLAGGGAAFLLWGALHRAEQQGLATAAIFSLGAGLALIGLAIERPLWRLLVVLFAAALILSYAAGGPEFVRLAG